MERAITSTDTPLVLLRTTRVGPAERLLADELAAASGLAVVHLVDGRNGTPPPEERPLVAIDDKVCGALGLHLPPDYAWRCGDYGVYLARRRFPEASAFWIVEGDVRAAGGPLSAFFAAMATAPHDMLASYVGPAADDWYWRARARGRGVVPYRCLFPVVRLSARLVDELLEKRRRQSRSWVRRAIWPNDEAFVATTAANGGFIVADLNAIDGPWYSRDLFSYDVTLDGDRLPEGTGRVQLMHSVKFGADLEARRTYPEEPETSPWAPLRRNAAFRLARFLRW